MSRTSPLVRWALLSFAACVLCFAEVALAGSDSPGFAHDASVVAWLAGLAALLAAALLAAAQLVRSVRSRRARA